MTDTSFDHICYTDDEMYTPSISVLDNSDDYVNMTDTFEQYISDHDSITESQDHFSSVNFNDTE